MSLRNYSWSNKDLKTASYGTSTASSKPSDTTPTTKKYDTSYSRTKTEAPASKESTRAISSLDKISTSSSRYTSPSNSFRSSYSPSPSSYTRDKSGTREKESNGVGNISTRYSNYGADDKSEKTSILNKYMSGRTTEKANDVSTTSYNRLSTNSSSKPRSRDSSPVDKNRYSYTRSITNLPSSDLIGRSSILGSKEKLNDTTAEKDKDNKSSKSSPYNSSAYQSYKLYSRPLSLNRPILKEEPKAEPVNTRYSRYSSTYSKPPLCSSPTLSSSLKETPKSPILLNGLSECKAVEENGTNKTSEAKTEEDNDLEESSESEEDESSDSSEGSMINITVVTRATSPTAPCSSVYLRTRRADMAKTIEKTITRPKKKAKMVDKEMQSDRLDDSTRTSRYGSTARISTSPWSSYTGYAGNASTRYVSSGLSGRYYNYTSSRDSDKSTTTSRTSKTSESETETPSKKPTEISVPKLNENIGVKKEMTKIVDSTLSNDISHQIEILNRDAKNTEQIERKEPLISKEKSPEKIIIPPPVEEIKKIEEVVITTEPMVITDQLPPQVPKSDPQSLSKSSSTASGLNKTVKKKIVKKVKSKEEGGTKKILKRSSSTSSAEVDVGASAVENADFPKPPVKLKAKSILKKSSSKSDSSSSTSEKVKTKSKIPPLESSSSTESNITPTDSSSDGEGKEKSTSIPLVNGFKEPRSTTSCLISSADETSLSFDNSTKPPPTPKSQKSDPKPGSEEAKSFLMRALAPVASLFKAHYTDSAEKHWIDSTGESDNQNTLNNAQSIATDSEGKLKLPTVKHIESGNRELWLASLNEKSSGSNKIKRSSSRSLNKDSTESSNALRFKLKKQESGEKAWWLQSSPNIPEGVEILPPSRKGSSDSDMSEKFDMYKIRPVESSEKDQWVPTNEDSGLHPIIKTRQTNGGDNFILNVVKIRHVESGEKAWWLASNKNIPEGIHCSSTDSSDSSDSEKNDQEEVIPVGDEIIVTGKYEVPLVLPDEEEEPLGDRKSPDGLETPQIEEGLQRRILPYDNLNFRQLPDRLARHGQMSKNLPDYISRHMDIDDVLGTSGHLFSPMMERLLARKTGQDLDGDSSECEEIDATQVRIHDSTAQRPVIQKVGSRNEIVNSESESKLEISAEEEQVVELKLTRQEMTCRVRYVNDTDPFRCWSEVTVPGKSILYTFSTLLPLTCQLPALHRLLGAPQKLDDSALQVYKDGDYGPYLDLESSLSEQQEELEGFLENRKNSIVLRTQLSVRVNAIIEKLLNSEGRELRRTLFSLKQIFQEDKDLVHEFVQNDGLDCLIRVGAGADQNYQNYILRALGQVMLYVDGMNGVMKHSPSLQWLYTLIASDYRLVVKTTLKLLLVFVEYIDMNCFLLIQAISAVDTSQGLPPWTNIINLLKDYEASDTELLIYSMTLINKCLSGITDHDIYYKQTDNLKEQGIYDIIKRYISFQTIDLDLKRQLQIYEASMNHQLHIRDKKSDESIQSRTDDSNADFNGVQPTKSMSLHLVNGNFSPSTRFNDASPTLDESKSSSPIRSSSDVFREKESLIDNHVLFVKKQSTVKDIAGKLSIPPPPVLSEDGNVSLDMAGIISKAIKGLSNCQIKESRSTTDVKTEVKRNNDIEWLNIAKALNRPLIFNSYDFSDLTEDEDDESPSGMEENVIPPPPPPILSVQMNANIPPPPMCPSGAMSDSTVNVPVPAKTKKTIKLFWREIPQQVTKIPSSTIWDELGKVKVDEASLEVLFETRTKEIIKEKQLEANKNKEVIVLDHKRSNAINILLKKLPPTQSIKNAIVNMDSSVLTREGIDKLLAMLPSKEEILKIQEAQVINPSTPLGKAEQFLLTLSSIYELNARLKLWAFKLDFECFQNEILEAYIDMKQAIEVLKVNVTFKKILACILSIGMFLNGSEAKGFQIEYLSKIQEVKDTVHKHSLLHHLCHMVLDQFPDTSDLYSEIGAVTRSSKINYEELSANIDRLETECKNHMGNFKIILKHDSTTIKTKVGDFLHDCAERIIILGLIKRRLFYRFSKFLIWLGVPSHHITETRPSEVFKIISEFALEYRTTRQQLQQQRQRKASHRERSKTRGKMITELNQIHLNEAAENELTNILNTNYGKSSSNPLGRKRKEPEFIRIEKVERSNSQEDGIEEVLKNILLEKSRTRKKERPSKNSQKLQNRSIKRSRTREGIPIEFGLQSA